MRTNTLRDDFVRLVNQWREERGPSSSFSQLVLQPAYQQIIGMGPAAIALILEELRREPDQWFWALRAITGEDPVPAEHAGDAAAMADDWLEWGAAHETLESFLTMYAAFGFAPCDGSVREPGFVKIAILVGPPDDSPEHVAIQVASGKWISKMGRDEDIAHPLEALEGRPHWWRVGAVIRCKADSIPAGLRRTLDRYGGP